MCGNPRAPSTPTIRQDRKVDLFVRVLREIFGPAPWSEVERSAHCAWDRIADITDQEWSEVRDRVHRTWSLH